MLVTIEDVSKVYLGNEVLQGIEGTIEDSDRIGLIGANGAGKSTLLRLICGLEDPDGGTIGRANNKTIGFLQQNRGLDKGSTILDEMKLVFDDLYALQRELKQMEQRMAELHSDPAAFDTLSKEYAQKQTYFEQKDGYLIDVKIKTILNGMGFGDKPLETVIHTLSGGEKTRLAMAKLLLEQPDLLVLDEPTNHLDFKTLMWLEEYLSSYKGALLIVSHDRYFLDKCVTKIWEIENHKLMSFSGNYSKYTLLKQEYVERRTKEYEIQQKQIASMQDYVDRNMARASTAKSARSRLNALEKMEIIEKPAAFHKPPHIRFTYDREPVKDVLDISHLELSVGRGASAKLLAKDITLHVNRGEKVAVIGANGIGKSSLLKAVQSLIPCPSGTVTWGRNTRISYYDQEMASLNPENTVLEELWGRFPQLSEHQVRSALGGVLLTGENVFKKVGVISGGERAKLSLAILMQEKPNVLILDEPTNHIDLYTKEVLEQALADYTGTILVVSHDRYLLNKVPTKIVEMFANEIRAYDGKFDDYLAAVQREQAAETEEKPVVIKPKGGGYKSKQQKSLEAKMRARLRELEGLVEQTEQQVAQLESEIATPEVYQDYLVMNEKCAELEQKKELYSRYFDEWVELSENF